MSDCYSDDVNKQRKVLKTIKLVLKVVDSTISLDHNPMENELEKPKELKLQDQKANVIKEMRTTERSYVEDLITIRVRDSPPHSHYMSHD